MSHDEESPAAPELAPVKHLLSDGLERCHTLVRQCRGKLVRALNPPDEEPPIFRWSTRRQADEES